MSAKSKKKPGMTRAKMKALNASATVAFSIRAKITALEILMVEVPSARNLFWIDGYREGLKVGIKALERILDDFE